VERTEVPGATSSGLIKREESGLGQIEGPRLEEDAMLRLPLEPTLTFPVQNTLTSLRLMFLGAVMVEIPEPLLPAEKTTASPAAERALNIGR